MILREATIKYAGYDPDDLKPKSQKRVCCVCDGCGRVRWQPLAGMNHLCKSCGSKLRFSRKEERKLASERLLKRYEDNPVPKGKNNPLYGKHLSHSHKQKISESNMGRGFSEITLEKMRGERVERIIKICPICNIEFPVLPDKNNINRIYCSTKCRGIANSGENNPAKRSEVRKLISEKLIGVKASPEAIQNLKASHRTEKYLEKMGGKNNPSWKGGISLDDYCHLFNLPLKESIRSYFNLNCFMDNEPEKNGRALSVHHVNYDKRCGCDATQFCIFVPVKAKWNAIFNGNKEYNRWYWYSFLMNKIFIEHPNYFAYHIPVWGMCELEYNYDYVFEKFRVV